MQQNDLEKISSYTLQKILSSEYTLIPTMITRFHLYCLVNVLILTFSVCVVVTSPKPRLMATLIGEVHSNSGIRNSVCRLLRIFIAQNINILYWRYNAGGLSIMGLVRHFPC